MANAISKLAIGGACAIALYFGALSRHAARAESLDHDPDAAVDLQSGSRNARGRMDKLDVDLFDLFPRVGGRSGGMGGVALGYRVLPELTTGVYFDAMLFGAAPDDPCHASGDCLERHVRFGAFGQMHFLPNALFDPWITIGAGGTTYEKLGADVSASAGIDLRVGELVALGPLFMRTQTIAGPQPSWNAIGLHALVTF